MEWAFSMETKKYFAVACLCWASCLLPITSNAELNTVGLTMERTAYHFQPAKNWMNDPNGPMFYKGLYHLFYQYNPKAAVWGNIVWGHAVSKDLINWKSLDFAIIPSEWYDIKGCWSGSATLLSGEKPVILYAGWDNSSRQVQNMVVPKNASDPYLREWVKIPENPIIVPENGINGSSFRDPTTAWLGKDGRWRIVVGNKEDQHHNGKALLYISEDFVHWTKKPRTTSPPPTYGPYDDLNDFDTSGPSETNLSYNNRQVNRSSTPHDRAPTTTTTTRSNSHRSATTSFAALLLRPLNLPRHVVSSSTIQTIILVMVYSFCITTLCFIFCTSYILTFYDDTKRIVGTSRVWARVKNGVRERLSMMGEDWEEFAKKYFDAAGLDHATNNTTSGRNGHLGGNQQTNNHNSKSAEWEDWMKGMMFGFVSFVAGQDVTNRFQHSTSSFKFQQPFANGAASDGTRK